MKPTVQISKCFFPKPLKDGKVRGCCGHWHENPPQEVLRVSPYDRRCAKCLEALFRMVIALPGATDMIEAHWDELDKQTAATGKGKHKKRSALR
jgi:hypothetical protein